MAEKKDYSNLRNKTIFDFTSDESVLKRVNSFSVFDKEDYLRHCKKDLERNIKDLAILAEVINDKELEAALNNQHGDLVKWLFYCE